MSQPLVIAVSPYHLATREAPALCALLLADRVVTLMPGPESGSERASFDLAVRRSPRFIRFMDRIRWSVPLWNEGVIAGEWDDEVVAEGLRDTCVRAAEDDAMLGMRRAFDAASRRPEHEFLDLVCADLLKGGPDPSVSIPVAACLDDFSSRHGLLVARAAGTSVAQRAESMLHRRRGAFVMPILTQASGRRILQLRRRLETELDEVRRALLRVNDALDVADAARSLTAAFERARADLVRGDDDSRQRVMDGYVSVGVVEAPTDAVFRSSVQALRSGTGAIRPAAPAVKAQPADAPPARLTALVIKPLILRPHAG